MVNLDHIFDTGYFIFLFFFCKLLFSSRAPFFLHFPLRDPSYKKQMVQRGAPWQMSVLRGICCVTGCLHWNIRAQCPSSDDQLVIAESAHAVFELSFLSSCLHSASLPSFVFSPARRCPLLSPTTKISQHAKIKTQAHERIHWCQSWRCVTGSLTGESQLGVTDSAFCPLLSLSCFVRTKWNDVNRGGVMSSLLKTKTEHKQNCSSPSFPRCLYIYKHALTFKLKKKKLQIWILLGTFYMCNYNVKEGDLLQ